MMNLKFQGVYNSISQFEDVEGLEDFTIITGLNGSGKTHFLKAIENGNILVNDFVPNKDIKYFSYKDFEVQNQVPYSTKEIRDVGKNAWAVVSTFIAEGKKIFDTLFGDEEKELLDRVYLARSPWKSQKPSHENISELVGKYIVAIDKAIFQANKINANPQKMSIVAAIKNSEMMFHKITKEEFLSNFFPYRQSDFFGTNISTLFTTYKKKEAETIYMEFSEGLLNKDGSAKGKEQIKQDFANRNVKPWDLFNELFQMVREKSGKNDVFNFKLTNPEEENIGLDSFQDYKFTSYLVKDENTRLSSFNLLSSGEKVLFALCITLYQFNNGGAYPKLLLLDEIDASLHPSVIDALLSTITNFILPKNTKVILATHSPTTVAKAPENSIYCINFNDKQDQIIGINNEEALELVSEGFVTFQEGMKISKKERMQLYLEGTTDIDYVVKCLDLFEKNRIKNLLDFNDGGGERPMKTRYASFEKVVNEISFLSKYLFIYDCDVAVENLSVKDILHKVKVNKISNNPINSGIENLFSKSTLERALKSNSKFIIINTHRIQHDGQTCEEEEWVVDLDQKRNLCDWLIENGTKEDFREIHESLVLLIEKYLAIT